MLNDRPLAARAERISGRVGSPPEPSRERMKSAPASIAAERRSPPRFVRNIACGERLCDPSDCARRPHLEVLRRLPARHPAGHRVNHAPTKDRSRKVQPCQPDPFASLNGESEIPNQFNPIVKRFSAVGLPLSFGVGTGHPSRPCGRPRDRRLIPMRQRAVKLHLLFGPKRRCVAGAPVTSIPLRSRTALTFSNAVGLSYADSVDSLPRVKIR